MLTFLLASVLLALAPGPDNLFVLTQSALLGRTSGLVVTLGLCTGLLVHTLAVACGVAAIFQASATAFSLLKFAGAGYLLYLAWQAFRAADQKLDGGARPLGLGQLYRRGIIMNLTNPKVSIFFLAFLPQFADPARGAMMLQFIVLGALFIIATILVFGTIALLAGALGEWMQKSPRVQSVMNKVAALVLLGLALKIATAHR